VRRSRLLRAVSLGAVAAATAVLFLVSRGKWSDPLIDSGREWIVPDALSRGALLYRDVVYWFGPFTPYWQASFFRLFGSSFTTLVLAGLVWSGVALAALFAALTRVTGRRQAAAWTALAIPLLVFMPNAGGAILGMGYRMWHAAGFALLAVAVLFRRDRADGGWRCALAGALAGLAGLCRTEWGLAALAGVVVAAARGFLEPAARRGGIVRIAAGFLLVELAGLGTFAVLAGPAALLRDAPVLLFPLPDETLERFHRPNPEHLLVGSAQMLYGSLTWIAVFLLVEIVALRRAAAEVRPELRRLGFLLLGLLVCLWIGGVPVGALFSGAPLICAAAVMLGLRSRIQPEGATLAGFGVLGILTSHRRLFFLTDGPYVAPPLLFAFVCAAGWAALAIRKHDSAPRRTVSSLLLVVLSSFAVAAFLFRGLEYHADERIPVPGTGGALSASPQTVRQVGNVIDALRTAAEPGAGLVVFPEGELLNYLSGRVNPIRHKLYLPGYLSTENEGIIIQELSRARPIAVVIWPRSLGEYGHGLFGRDYGVVLGRWIETNCRPVAVADDRDRGRLGYCPSVSAASPDPRSSPHASLEMRADRLTYLSSSAFKMGRPR
jgi:hypothetical protein